VVGLIGNNVQNVTSDWELPPIYLWTTSTNNVVAGSGNLKINVLDEGTNNILVGVNNMAVNVGQYISDAMKEAEAQAAMTSRTTRR
jgi:hypothetical protein